MFHAAGKRWCPDSKDAEPLRGCSVDTSSIGQHWKRCTPDKVAGCKRSRQDEHQIWRHRVRQGARQLYWRHAARSERKWAACVRDLRYPFRHSSWAERKHRLLVDLGAMWPSILRCSTLCLDADLFARHCKTSWSILKPWSTVVYLDLFGECMSSIPRPADAPHWRGTAIRHWQHGLPWTSTDSHDFGVTRNPVTLTDDISWFGARSNLDSVVKVWRAEEIGVLPSQLPSNRRLQLAWFRHFGILNNPQKTELLLQFTTC